MRAIVVGAGLAGLAAADELQRGGVGVVCLEARERVGGRVWSRTLPDGSVVELGAEFVLPGNTTLRALADRLGLELWPKGMRYGDREPRGGIGVDREDLVRGAQVVAEALASSPDDAARISVAAFLSGLGLDPGVHEAIVARVEVSSGTSADVVAADALAGLAAHAADDCPSIAGGNQTLALALAGELDAPVRLRCPVERIVWGDRGVRVHAAGAEVDGDVAVVAVPASVLGRIEFAPALPDAIAAAVADVVYGHAAKLFVPLRESSPASAVLSVPGRFWTWTATGARGVVQPVVHAFAGSADALARLDVERGPERWLAELARLRPDLALDGGNALLSTWDDDPWVQAAYFVRAAGPPTEDVLTRPLGPLRFCGEHTAGPFAALMEGALRSGIRAARSVLEGVG